MSQGPRRARAPVKYVARKERIAALDGLRGLAIIAVVLFHAGVAPVRGGFLGVDLFFVLSGFLITDLLLAEPLQLRRFWSRRARRLLPPLLALVAVCAVSIRFFSAAGDRARLSLDGLSALTYVSNWRFALGGRGYFDQTALPSPLLHTWSLSIEEQFYLLWPLVVALAAHRRRPTVIVGAVAGAAAVASWTLSIALGGHGVPSARAYYGTDTRAHAIFVGAALAAAYATWGGTSVSTPSGMAPAPLAARKRALLTVVGVGALLAIFAMWSLVDGQSRWLGRGGVVAVDLTAAAVIAAVVLHPEGILSRALSLPALVWVGIVSYSVYVWHWPIDLLLTHGRTGLSRTPLLGVRLAATAAAGVVSWRFIERPFRAGAMAKRPAVLSGALAALLVLVMCLPPAMASHPVAPAEAFPIPAASPSPAPMTPRSASSQTASSQQSSTPITVAALDPNRPLRAVVFGDSVVRSAVEPILGLGRERGIELIDEGVLGCGVARGGPYRYFGSTLPETAGCSQWPDRWRKVLASARPDVVVIMVGRWEIMDRTHDGSFTHVGDAPFDRYLEDELRLAVRVGRESGAHVVLCTAPYFKRGERPDGGLWPEDETGRVDRFNELVRLVAGEGHKDDVTLADFGHVLNPDGAFTTSVNGVKVRYDGVHLTSSGARLAAPVILDAIRHAAATP